MRKYVALNVGLKALSRVKKVYTACMWRPTCDFCKNKKRYLTAMKCLKIFGGLA